MSKPLFTERLSFGVTPEMDRYLEELARARSRQGKPTSKADLLREAVRFYLDQQADLTGSRRQIAKSLEGKLDMVISGLQTLNGQGQTIQRHLQVQTQQMQTQSQEIASWRQELKPLLDWIASRRSR